MKKLTFHVVPKKNVDFEAIAKTMEAFQCRLSFDEENSQVIAEEVTDIKVAMIPHYYNLGYIIS